MAVAACGLGTTAMAVAVALTGERWWPVALAAVFAPWWLTVATGVFVVALLLRRWWGAACFGAAAVAWAAWYGPRFIPARATGAIPGTGSISPLRVATFNIGANRTTWTSLMPVLQGIDADIVGLHEVSNDNAARLGTAVADTYPHRFLYGGGTLGMGVLSRYPMDAVERLRSGWPGRDSLRTVIHTPSGPVTLVVAHPHQPVAVPVVNGLTAYRQDPAFAADIERLLHAVDGAGTTLLVGDFNLPERHSSYASLRAVGLIDVFDAVGWGFGFTWPMQRAVRGVPVPALVRIDYVWCTADVQPLRAWVGTDDAGSDHRPVVADVRIRGSRPLKVR